MSELKQTPVVEPFAVVIHGTLNEVGTNYGDQAAIVVKVDKDDAESEFVTIAVTKEHAKAFGRYLYQPVTITVTAGV